MIAHNVEENSTSLQRNETPDNFERLCESELCLVISVTKHFISSGKMKTIWFSIEQLQVHADECWVCILKKNKEGLKKMTLKNRSESRQKNRKEE